MEIELPLVCPCVIHSLLYSLSHSLALSSTHKKKRRKEERKGKEEICSCFCGSCAVGLRKRENPIFYIAKLFSQIEKKILRINL